MPPDPNDLRATVEAAVEQVEKPAPVATPAVPETPAAEAAPVEHEQPEAPVGEGEQAAPTEGTEPEQKAEQPKPETEAPKGETEEQRQRRFSMERAPKSWGTAEARNAWKHVPLAAREEIIRRERETSRVLGENAQRVQVAKQFMETIRPYEARIRSTGLDPIRAVDELMKADHILSTANQSKKAALVAQIIKEYGVDIAELDNVLAGQPSADPVQERVEQLVAQRLSPFEQFVKAQAQAEMNRRQAEQFQTVQTVQQMAQDARFPHFESVREVMADMIEAAGNRGVALSLEDAYKRAVAIDPRLSSAAPMQGQSAAAQANARAQKALNASVSVAGAPNGGPSALKPGADLRSTIEAAFQQASGR